MPRFILELASATLLGSLCTIFLNAPRSTWKQSASMALIGWLVQTVLQDILGLSSPVSTYIAAVVLAVAAQYFARKYKQPSSIFFVPGYFTLVPGSLIYQTVLSYLNGDLVQGREFLFDTLLTGIAIVLGLFTIDSLLYKTKLYPYRSAKKADKVSLAESSGEWIPEEEKQAENCDSSLEEDVRAEDEA